MKSTILIEIEMPVSYTVSKGYLSTLTEPGKPSEAENIEFKDIEVRELIQYEIDKNYEEIEQELLTDYDEYQMEMEQEYYEYKREMIRYGD